MNKDGSLSPNLPKPLWLCAELTYSCPLQCPYCSNPLDFASQKDALTTEDWIKVFREARRLGAVQLGFSGGEPLLRLDLEELVREARRLGYYTNLITSAYGLSEKRLRQLKDAGLDHIQISFQAGNKELNDFMAGTDVFEQKLATARLVKQFGYDLVLNFVIYRDNIDHIELMLDIAAEIGADQVELANTQYYGWAFLNRDRLLPTREQVQRAEAIAHRYQDKFKGRMRVLFVVPDYYENRPKACMNGWGNLFLTVAPDGTALPCQAARQLPGITFPNVKQHSIEWIWYESPAFNKFRGFDWMREPCRSCPERFKDFGGCRCQAFLLTGDPANTDPVCDLSPHHDVVLRAIASASERSNRVDSAGELVFRNVRNSKLRLAKTDQPMGT